MVEENKNNYNCQPMKLQTDSFTVGINTILMAINLSILLALHEYVFIYLFISETRKDQAT